MGAWGRLWYGVFGIISMGVLAVLYARAAVPLIEYGKDGGQFSGAFSQIPAWIETVIPPLIGLVVLAMIVFLVIGNAREERATNRDPRRRP